MNVERIMNDIRNTGDLIPDQYDGSYELMRSIVEQYALMDDYSDVTYLDLNAVYGMAIGTWKMSIEKKKEYISKTSLPDSAKEHLYDVCDDVWDKACREEYQHSFKTEIGLASKGKPIIGMFGTGFYSFHKATDEESRRFIELCAKILNIDDDNAVFDMTEPVLQAGITGMAAGSASVILHCLKPYTFPIINGNYIGETIYPVLGVKLNKANSLRHFISNCRLIKQFRDSNFSRINYRVFDEASMFLDKYMDNQINIKKLETVIKAYKEDFERIKKEETYKWRAVKHFKDHFSLDADQFAAMLEEATRLASNLLSGGNFLARATLLETAKEYPEEVRGLFKALFDETVPVLERIPQFKSDFDELFYRTHSKEKNSYQSDRSVTVYLFFEYPEKYCPYMPTKFDAAAKCLEFGELAAGGSTTKLKQYFEMTDQIWKYALTDKELIELSRSRLDKDCYPDPENHILVQDIVWFIARDYKEPDEPELPASVEPETDYWPSQDEYPLQLTKEDWVKYLTEIEMPDHPEPMKMLKAMMELGGEASPKQLSEEYGGSPSRYVGCTMNLGRRAMKYFKLSPCPDGDAQRVFPIPFQGHVAEWNGNNYYAYRIRPELQAALNEVDLSDIDPHVTVATPTENTRYWMYSPGKNASMWTECVKEGVAVLGWHELEDLSLFDSREEIIAKMKEVYGDESQYWMNSKATWDFSHVIKPGDVIYAKKGRSKLVGRGTVTSEYHYDPEWEEFPNMIDVEWTDIGEWEHPGLAQVKTLTEIDKYSEYAEKLNLLFEQKEKGLTVYTKESFLDEVYMSAEDYEELKNLLFIKKNIILQGAPGVGKTFTAKRLAYSIMGCRDDSRIEFIQFHQNYSYEDFIMGYKPDENGGFVLQEGVFYNFCKRAETDPDKEHKYFFIIDEINRGNLSKIFGELMMALENDYRKEKVRLAYRDEGFSVPENVYLIGMMNTADRSLALIDYALRRRFSFVSMKPGFETDGFKEYQTGLHNDHFDALINQVIELNKVIGRDESLGDGFRIGHSYFCGLTEDTCTDERLRQIVRYDLIPTLEEYWFDNKDNVDIWKKNLEDALK